MVRLLLKEGKAKVLRTPFTIRLLATVKTYTQEITLSVDAGSRHDGMSATTETKELYASETELRSDVSAIYLHAVNSALPEGTVKHVTEKQNLVLTTV